jgi:hypothetical protein
VNTVATDIADVTTVADDIANVNTVAGNTANIDIVAGINADVTTVAGIEADVQIVADNVADITNFSDVYQGPKSTPPTLRNDGGALQLGDLYFNTVSNAMFVYASTGWVPAGSSVNGTSRRFRYIATSGQTTFTGTDSNGNTMAYDAGFVDVYLNGVRLDETDYTASSGDSIVLGSAAALNDELNIVAFGTFAVADINGVDIANGTVTANKFGSDAPLGVSDKANTSTGYMMMPVGTTAQRPASPAAGMFRFNTTRNLIEYYDATNAQWFGIGSFAATGGTVTTAGGYTIHTFTSSGTFTVLQGVALCDVLVVAGAGGGARLDGNGSGGGGAGGLLEGSLSLFAGAYTVTVGAGGAAGASSGANGATGNNSVFGSATANGGGGGGAGAGLNGGSGGGGGQNSAPGTATQGTSGGLTGFGNAGGTGVGFGGNGGGGGGAGGAGQSGGSPSAGGVGRSNSYSGSAVTYSAGGAGQLALGVAASSGAANTGNGGGAGYAASAGNGGSGIVIIRYLTP